MIVEDYHSVDPKIRVILAEFAPSLGEVAGEVTEHLIEVNFFNQVELTIDEGANDITTS